MSGKKRTMDRGLDGGYWSTMPVEETTRNKRRRTGTGRLDLSSLNASRMSNSADESMTTFTDNESSIKNFDETSQNTESTNQKSEKRYVIFNNRQYLTVRNETGGFFLCQAVEKIYDDSKLCRIQWLEEAGDNKFKLGYVDKVDHLTIITKVNVRQLPKVSGETFYEIYEEDLKKVNDLLEKALKEGGITVEFPSAESEDSSSDEEALPNNRQKSNRALENKEFYDKEEDEPVKKHIESSVKKEDEPVKKKKKLVKKAEKPKSSSESSDSDSSSASEPAPKKRTKGDLKKKTKLVVETDDSVEKSEKPSVNKSKEAKSKKSEQDETEAKNEPPATTPKPSITKSSIEIKRISEITKKSIDNGDATNKKTDENSTKKVKKKIK